MTASPTPVPDIGRSPWFSRVVRKEEARARLLCLPFAGGGADFYRGWSDWLPPDLEVWPVQPPGRGARMMERTLDDLAAMVHSIAEAVTPLLDDLPVIVFGHSMGALLAFELAHELVARSAPAPNLLILSGRPAPTWRLPRIRHVMTDAELLEELRSFAGTPAEALNNPELMELMLPTIRADFKLVETYRRPAGRLPLGLPIFVCCGDADDLAPAASLNGWREETAMSADIRLFPGGHFYLAGPPEAVRRAIRGVIEDRLPESATSGDATGVPASRERIL